MTVTAPPPARQPATLDIFRAEQHTHILSQQDIAMPDAPGYRLFLARPRAAAPPRGYGVFYMLDGNGAFDELTPELLALVPDVIVAGIGYDTVLRFDGERRTPDYTPSPDGSGLVESVPGGRMTGGADLFLARLCGPLRAAVEEGAGIDPARRMLWGHSLGGLFVLHTLLARPGAFARLAAASPALWWGDEWLLQHERIAQLPEDVRVEILITLGDSERRSSPTAPQWNGPAPHTLAMVERLRVRPQCDVSLRVFEGLGHAASLAASLPHALTMAAR